MELNAKVLGQFTGTENYFVYGQGNRRLYLTDGTLFLAEQGQAFWLMDIIVSYQGDWRLKHEDFQVWKLKKLEKGWKVTCDDGNGTILITQEIEYSDFPLDETKLYVMGGVIMLPGEY